MISLSKDKKIIKEFFKYYFLSWISFINNSLIVYISTDILANSHFISIILIYLNSTIMFFLEKFFVFRNKEKFHRQIIIYLIRTISVNLIIWIILSRFTMYNYTFTYTLLAIIFSLLSFTLQKFYIFK